MGHYKSNMRDLQFNLFELFELDKVLESGEFGDLDLKTAVDMLREVRALADYQIAQTDLAFATGTLLGATKVQWAPVDPRQNPVLTTPQGARVAPPDEPSGD